MWWANGRIYHFYIWDLEKEVITRHAPIDDKDHGEVWMTMPRNAPDARDNYWWTLRHERHLVINPEDGARWDAYLAEHEGKAPRPKAEKPEKKPMSRAMVWFLIILFVVAGLLYNMSSCSFHDPLNRMM